MSRRAMRQFPKSFPKRPWPLALCALFLAMGVWLEAMIGLRLAGWVDDPLRRARNDQVWFPFHNYTCWIDDPIVCALMTIANV